MSCHKTFRPKSAQKFACIFVESATLVCDKLYLIGESFTKKSYQVKEIWKTIPFCQNFSLSAKITINLADSFKRQNFCANSDYNYGNPFFSLKILYRTLGTKLLRFVNSISRIRKNNYFG